MSQAVHLRKYGVQAVVNFELYEIDGVDLKVDAADAGSDCTVMKDQGAEATCTNDFVDEGKGYSLTLTATEMQAAQITVYIVDSATKVWLDKVLHIETYGNASAMHAMDLDDAVRGGMTALPNAAADAAGGLPISDAGGLDIDTQLAATNEVTAARMATLTDWINGGRLDLLLDAIPTTAMRGTDGANTVVPDAAGVAPTAVEVRTEIDSNSTQLTAIVADTNELQVDNVPGLIAALNNLSAADVNAEADTALSDFFTSAAQLVDDIWDEVLTGAAHNDPTSAGRRLRLLGDSGLYAGAIWIDTANGTAGTTDYENGTDTNPVDSIADANTLAASLGISRFKIAPGSTITFAAAQQDQIFEGYSWTLALGGQNIDGSTVVGAAVSGVSSNTAGSQYFIECLLGAVTLPADTHCLRCGIAGTQTVAEAGDYFWDLCHSGIAGTTTPALDVGAAIANTNINFRNYSGGIEIQNFGASGADSMSLEGRGQLVIAASCTGGTVAIRGSFTVTDNAGGAVTLSDVARFSSDQLFDSSTDKVTVDSIDVDVIDAVAVKADAANEVADAWLDRAGAVDGYTPRQILRMCSAVLLGKASGLDTTTAVYRDAADVKDRVTATVDADGNRSAVTLVET